MAYCSLNDILANIPDKNIAQITDDTGTDVINNSVINEAIAYAEELINSYLRGRYTVPLNPTPGLIKKICVDITIFYLYSRRFEFEIGEAMANRYKNAIKLLEHIQKGMVQLGVEGIASNYGDGHYKTNKTPDDEIFNKSLLNQF